MQTYEEYLQGKQWNTDALKHVYQKAGKIENK
jgi:hypothetical protein